MNALPSHLRKYVVEQDYAKYTPVDQAVWRYVLRQLRAFLAKHAHECYLEGLDRTGIGAESIPRIEEISGKLEKFGWRAIPVSGFIPPAAFMELQSLGVLPIASDMRTIDHLTYTPAPDIVHEAAGHAPILIHPEFSEYLQQYAQIARKAIISSEDLAIYEAIRVLSDAKEDPRSSSADIDAAQRKLEEVSAAQSHVSEATQLGRMNWWTAEYGLIGDIKNPRIFGAGLLSSVGEARWCLSANVKKIPLSVDCIEQGYDITEPQPQLFVAPDFKTLKRVLEDMAARMAFRVGGLAGVKKAIQAKTVNTIELNSGIQISGIVEESLGSNPDYLRLSGASQLSFAEKELPGHDRKYHAQGFGTAVGRWAANPEKCPSEFSELELTALGFTIGKRVSFKYESGVHIEGELASTLRRDGKLVLLAFKNCRVTLGERVLFDPTWGTYDLAIGSTVISVFGGPADRAAFGETDDFVAKRVPPRTFSETEKKLHAHYQTVRALRAKCSPPAAAEELLGLLDEHHRSFPKDWLLDLEALEIALQSSEKTPKVAALEDLARQNLKRLASLSQELKSVIEEGVALANAHK